MSDMTTAQKDKLMADLKLVIADAEELLRLTAGQVSEGAAEVRSRLLARLQPAKVQLTELQDAAIAKAKAAGLATDEFVQENPWKAIGASAGIGLLIGLLIGRR